VDDPEPVTDRTEKGDEKQNSFETDLVKNPKQRAPVVDVDAYRDERVFYIPSGQLFLGGGSVLSGQGRDSLDRIASFMALVPCKVIIGEVRPGAAADDVGLARSWTVLQFFTDRGGLPAGRFRLAATNASPSQSFRNEPVMQISLLARDVTQ